MRSVHRWHTVVSGVAHSDPIEYDQRSAICVSARFVPREGILNFCDGAITAEIADRALAILEIDENGLEEMDKRILEAVIVKFGGGPVGVNSLAVTVGEEPDTLEEVYEPYLIMEGYLKRTSQGRVATELGYKKLGLKATEGSQARLF